MIARSLNYKTAEIIRFVNSTGSLKAVIGYKDMLGNDETQLVSIEQIYLPLKTHSGLTLWERIDDGIILGFGVDRCLIRRPLGIFLAMAFSQVKADKKMQIYYLITGIVVLTLSFYRIQQISQFADLMTIGTF